MLHQLLLELELRETLNWIFAQATCLSAAMLEWASREDFDHWTEEELVSQFAELEYEFQEQLHPCDEPTEFSAEEFAAQLEPFWATA